MLYSCTGRFVSDLVGTPKDWFSCIVAHLRKKKENPEISTIFFFFFFIHFYAPFKIISAHMRPANYETGQSVGGAKTGEPLEKTPGSSASRTWLDSHIMKSRNTDGTIIPLCSEYRVPSCDLTIFCGSTA